MEPIFEPLDIEVQIHRPETRNFGSSMPPVQRKGKVRSAILKTL